MSVDDFKVIYLGGMGRSGSTLIERLLGELPGVCVAGEAVHLWERGVLANERCGCGTEFRSCEFWSRVGDFAFGGWPNLDVQRIAELRASVDRTRFIPLLATRSLAAGLRRDLGAYTGYYHRLYQALATVSGCRTIVDSSKHASLAFCLSHREELDLRVVHLVRDSRAVAYSWTRQVRRPEAAAESFMTRYSPLRAAREWNAQNGALRLLARTGTPVTLLRYEDLIQAVKPALRSLANFAGLAAPDTGLAFIGGEGPAQWARLHRAHTAAGNPMRFTAGRIAIRSDDRWQQELPDSARRAVTALTLPLLSHYGYLRGTR
jgi:hypothetical protein